MSKHSPYKQKEINAQLLEALKALYVNCEAPAKYLDMADKAIREAMKKAEAS